MAASISEDYKYNLHERFTMTEQMKQDLATCKVMPVIAIPDLDCVKDMGGALVRGGIPFAEITFRTKHAVEAIKLLRQNDLLYTGAGTVINVEQAQQAYDAGAQFVVSPGFNPKVVAFCIDKNLPIFPGVITPSEIQQALEFGLDILKFFPATAFDGLNVLPAFKGPFADTKFIPTGGITIENLPSYLELPNVFACGGSWLTPKKTLEANDAEHILKLVQQTRKLVDSL
ncbi:MAG: 2-dehydro-3-deoxyphosphogluconate aldolase [Planctomycetota bacterium]|nr:MAG: 2-dehydro-3-deoxyphosphogluconate aldolase [Planctomycetota bacterium]